LGEIVFAQLHAGLGRRGRGAPRLERLDA
jgi:hypothetical protein